MAMCRLSPLFLVVLNYLCLKGDQASINARQFYLTQFLFYEPQQLPFVWPTQGASVADPDV